MEKTEKKSLLSGIFVMVLSVIAFICIASGGNNGKMPDYTAYADEYTTSSTTSIGLYNGIIKYASYDTHVAILEYDEITSEIVEIPSEINGLPVTRLGNDLFNYNYKILSVVIPNSIENIDECAFIGCYALNYIEIPEKVASIDLSSVSSLKKVAIRNPECKIIQNSDSIPKSAVIYGYPDSTAEEYANNFNREFIDIQYYENIPVTTSTTITTTSLTTTSVTTTTKIPATTVWTTWWTTTTRRPATTSIGIYNGNIQYLVSENYSYTTHSYTTTVILTECKNDVSGEIEIPEDINGLSIEEIRSRAFSSCSALDSITLPESVKNINNNAFNANLKKIIIKNPECNIYNHWDTIPDSTVIYGYADSTAQQYAQTFSREFVILDGEPSETFPSSTSTAPPTTTTPAKKFGDIDGNNIIDAVDASLILSYYAYTSTGGTAEFEEFLASGNY